MLSRLIGRSYMVLMLGFATHASALSFTLDQSFGAVAASGEVAIDITTAMDGLSATIQIDTTDLTSPEFVKELYLNTTDVSALTGPNFGASTPSLQSMSWGNECCKSDGDGKHDILLQFAKDAGSRLEAGAIYTVVLEGIGLTEAMFNDLGTLSDKGQFHAVAKINSTGVDGEGSDWIGDGNGVIPEPSAVALYGVSLFLVGIAVRRRRS